MPSPQREAPMVQGHLCLVFHAHLPFVRHPEYEDFLEEDWLYEAITETYIPLLEVLDGLERDGIDYRLTMSISPTLATMLGDALLQQRYLQYLDNLIDLAAKEIERTRWTPDVRALARMYHQRFSRCREVFVHQYAYNLLDGFRRFFATGRLELITCAATHGFLPLMANANARWAQIEVGCREFQRNFGRRPRGIWLPECGYAAGLDLQLRDAGLEYFFLDTHGALFAEPSPKFGVYAPICCPQSGLFALARDAESSRQVWSSVEGYPGDHCYRDFYRDIGFDLDYNYLRPHLHLSGVRSPTGIKYYKITGATDRKEIYDPQVARERTVEHARDFLSSRQQQCEWLLGLTGGRPPLIVAPYDAELLGHWWFEGPEWLDALLREIQQQQSPFATINVSEYLRRYPEVQQCEPAVSSWGASGYNEVWLEGSNDWVYRHLHELADRMVELARQFPTASGLLGRALNQAARELLLAQSSDWAFIMKTGTMVDYAVNRTKTHILNFNHLYEQISQNEIDEPWLRELESRHNCFPTIDYRLYA